MASKLLSALLVLTFATATHADPSFPSPPTYAIDAEPRAIASADFDEDGDLDLAVASSNTHLVFVLEGDGAGGFAPAQTYGDAPEPRSVAAEDFDGDGHIDIAVSTDYGTAVAVFPGAGDGTFGSPISSVAISGAYFLAAAHFDADGVLDLAIASLDINTELRTISILLGDGSGGFAIATTLNGGDFAVGDFNGDTFTDVAAAADPTALQLYLGNDDGTFVNGETLSTGDAANTGYVRQVLAADLDGNGALDLIVPRNTFHEELGVLLGNGDGSFGAVAVHLIGTVPAHILADDLDLDGNVDLAVASKEREHVSILPGDGTGGFETPATFVVSFGPVHVHAADFNGDAKPDLAVANVTAMNVAVLLGDGAGDLPAATRQIALSGTTRTIAAADFDGDDHLDIAVARESGSVTVLFGDGLGAFSGQVDLAGISSFGQSIVAADLDGDGDQDIALTQSGSLATDPRGIALFFGNGAGAFAPAVMLPYPAIHLLAADLNLDGRVDLAAVTTVNFVRGVQVHLNAGGGTFASPVHYPSGPSAPKHVAAADLNGDAFPDLIVANFAGAHSLSFLFGNGNGTFSTPELMPVTAVQSSGFVAAADLDGDGDIDLASAHNNGGAVSILLGNGDGTFGSATIFAGGGSEIAVSDVDGDGALDLALTYAAELSLAVLLGDGTGAFSQPFLFPGGASPFGIAAGDFREDNRIDFVITNYTTRNITPLWNITGGENTPGGANVIVQTTPATLTFEHVNSEGTTTLTTSSTGPTPPAGFVLGEPPTYLDLKTTATFSGAIAVCIDYRGYAFTNESQLTLQHYEGEQWTDVTTSLDTANDLICGSVTSLSPFALFEPEGPVCPMLTALQPAQVRIGLKNHHGIGSAFDLRARVYRNDMLAGSGEVHGVSSGENGFSKSVVHGIALTLIAPIAVCPGDVVRFDVAVRNSCASSGESSAVARFWYNDGVANSRFGATIGGSTSDYFLRAGFTLATTAGPGPKLTSDVPAGTACGPFRSFGTWSATP